MSIYLRNIIVVFWVLTSVQVYCQDTLCSSPIIISSNINDTIIDIQKHVKYIIDEGREAPFEEIKNKEFNCIAGVFKKKELEKHIEKSIDQRYWINFDITCKSKKGSCLFYLNGLDFVGYDLYKISKTDSTTQIRMELGNFEGSFTPESVLIPIELKSNQKTSVFIFVKNNYTVPQKVKIELVGEGKKELVFREKINAEIESYNFYIFTLGLILFLIASNLMTFIYVKEKVFAIYCLFLISQLLFIQGHFEYEFSYGKILLHKLLNSKNVFYIHQNLTFSSCILYVLFMLSFFSDSLKDSYIKRYLNASLYTFTIILLINICAQLAYGTSSTYDDVHFICLVLSFFVGIFTLFFIVKIENPLKKIIASGIILYYLGKVASFTIAFLWDIEDESLLSSFSFYIRMSLLLEVFCFTLALGFRTFIIRQEKRKIENERKINEEKIRLYDWLVHEFRSPLTVINANTELLLKKKRTKLKEEKSLNHIRSASSVLEVITDDFSALSKMKYSSVKENFINEDLIGFVQNIVNIYLPVALERKLSLSFSASVDELFVDFVPRYMQEILTNLIDNALKFTPEFGQIKVTISTEKDLYFIRISDTGIGIPKNERELIFQEFYRASNAKKEGIRGTGLGLAIIKTAVKYNRGKIQLCTAENKGTTFILNFKITRTAPYSTGHINNRYKISSKISYNANLQKSKNDRLPLDKKIILLVEDDFGIRDAIKETLEEQNYFFLEARNGLEGLSLAQEKKPKLIITDEMMPELSGFSMVEQLKKEEDTKSIPIIMLTARAARDYEKKALELKVHAYMRKPFDRELLILTVKNVLSNENSLNTNEIYWNDKIVANNYAKRILEIIRDNYQDSGFTVNRLYSIMQREGMGSSSTISRKISKYFDTSPAKLIKTYRLLEAQKLLVTTTLTLDEIIRDIGLTSERSNFSSMYSSYFGKPPSEYRN